jgi:pimeloyl-ACP methyl ester carboxylesterase
MPKFRFLSSLVLLMLPLSAVAEAKPATATRPADRPSPPAAKLEPCKVPGENGEVEARCGFFETWENRAARSGRKIRLKVVVVPARGPHPKPDPVFAFGGGPGQAITTEAGGAPGFQEELRKDGQDRDFVFIDQRGTGEPDRLGCNLGGQDSDLQTYLGEMFPVDAVRQCREELEKKYDLTLYTTDVAMDDIDDARVWLGYGKINLIGGSYGTRAAQVYLRRHPGSVRTVILDGVVPMDETLPLSHAAGGQRSLDLLLGWCEKDPACHGAYPDVRKDLQTMLDRLAQGPAQVEIENPVTHQKVSVKVSREVITDGIRWQLYTPAEGAALPRLIHEAAAGSLSPLAQASVQSRVGLPQLLAMGMFFSVTCAEDIPFIDPGQIAARTAGSFLSDYRVRQQMGACAVWPRAKVPAGHREAVRSDVPVLLINGERDPVTPPAFGDRTAKLLSNSLHVVVPWGAHGGETTPCVNRLQKEAIEKGAVKGLDTSCLAQIRMTPFQTEPPKPAG